MEVRNSEGTVGRCDAHCYHATESGCQCVCGGRNHGAGLERALANTRELAETLIQEYAQERGWETYDAHVSDAVFQKRLAL